MRIQAQLSVRWEVGGVAVPAMLHRVDAIGSAERQAEGLMASPPDVIFHPFRWIGLLPPICRFCCPLV